MKNIKIKLRFHSNLGSHVGNIFMVLSFKYLFLVFVILKYLTRLWHKSRSDNVVMAGGWREW